MKSLHQARFRRLLWSGFAWSGFAWSGFAWIGFAWIGFAVTLAAGPGDSVRAASPVVTVNSNSVRIQVAAARLVETIDALARAAKFKVTYEGARPSGMLFGTEIDTPTVAQTLSRLLDGQNLNYAVLFDLSGERVTSLLILGVAPKSVATSGPAAGNARPQPFATPRTPRVELPPVDEDPAEEQEETEEPEPEPEPPPAAPTRGLGSPGSPFPGSPFAPRSPFGAPYGARPTPAPSPSPSP